MSHIKTLSRRAAIVIAVAAGLLTASCAKNASAPAEGDMSMGTGAVTVVEYASVTCHVCAAEIPTPPAPVAVAGFQIARCAGEERYFDVVHALLESQSEWQNGGNPRDTLFRIGNGAGLNNSQIETCIKDADGIEKIEARAKAANAAGVSGTPSFFVNGRQIVSPGSQNGPTLADISAAIDAELAK